MQGPSPHNTLPRDAIAEFIKSPRGIRAYEAMQGNMGAVYDAVANASFLTITPDSDLGSERVLTPVSGDLVGTDGGAGSPYTLGLADTSVAPGSYGAATLTLSFSVDAKGRLQGAQTYPLVSDNVAEGSANLYFTNARAIAAVSSVPGLVLNGPLFALRTITASGGVLAGDYTILANASTAPITVTLPPAASSAKRVLAIKKIDGSANAVTIQPNASEQIEGATSRVLANPDGGAMLHCDGAGWWVIALSGPPLWA